MLADPRAQIRKRRGSEQAVSRTFYRLADEPRDTILVACSKCEWKAAYQRAELIAAHGPGCPMPSLLERLAAPGCPRLGSQWDRCGVHYAEITLSALGVGEPVAVLEGVDTAQRKLGLPAVAVTR